MSCGVRGRFGIGSRGAVLLTLAATFIGIGLSWVWPTAEQARAQSTLWRDSFAPSWAWGMLWIAVGISCSLAATCRRFDEADWGFGPAGALMLWWALMEALGWLVGRISSGYRPTLIWISFGVLIYFIARLADRSAPPPPDDEEPTP